MTVLTQERLKELLHYEADTGVFIWSSARGSSGAGRIAGSLRPDGYRQIQVNGKSYQEHRLAWLYAYGEFPSGKKCLIDHIDGNKTNNRLDNLRACSDFENQRNTRKRVTNTSGFKGVSWDKKSKKWQAQIYIDGKKRTVGRYSIKEDAHAARCAVAEKVHKEFVNNV